MSNCKLTPHKRRSHGVRGHFRNTRGGRVWISDYTRGETFVNSHCILP